MHNATRRVPRARVSIGLATAGLLMLPACSDDAGGDSNEGEEVVVDFWHVFGGHREEWINEAVAEYNEMTDGVTVTAESKSSYFELLDALFLAEDTDSIPAVAQVVVTASGEATESGAFKMISEVDTEGKINDDDYLESVMSQLVIDGELSSVPWANSTTLLAYDKGMFEDAGLDPESPPQTFDEVLDACEQIVDEAGVAPTCVALPWTQWLFENWLATQNAVILDQGNGHEGLATEAFLNTPEAITVGDFYRELVERGYYEPQPPQSGVDWEFARQQMTESEAAMTVTGSAELGFFTDTFEEQGRELGAGFFPAPSASGSVGTSIGGGTLWITNGLDSATEQAALDFILWLASPEMSAEWHKVTGYLPVNREAEQLLQDEGWFDDYPTFQVAIDQLGASQAVPATSVPVHPAYTEIQQEALLPAIEEIVVGHGEVERALTEANDVANDAITRMNELL